MLCRLEIGDTAGCKPALPLFAVVLLALGLTWPGESGAQPSSGIEAFAPRPRGQLTFNREIAPILFRHCAPCHRPGQSAPFDLLTYADARKHAPDIVRVTRSRYMPPWLPEPGYGEFTGERRLSADEIGVLRQWVEEGIKEGNASDLPAPPGWTAGWQLGEPDLVLRMPAAYRLGPDGPDVYRNFVIPIPVRAPRYVRAFEFHPGNKSVHHVRLLLDALGQCRELDSKDLEPGFEGMSPPAKFPPGHLLTWTPGRVPAPEAEGQAWLLEPGTDLVLQTHLQRTGKPEQLEAEGGLYFTNRAPARAPFLIGLVCQLIDIPAGATNYAIERTFHLPVDVEALAVLPHAHYLAKEIRGYARLPDGSTNWLIFIRNWDFNWQDEYRYRRPVPLPKGSAMVMHFTYDNSADNERNPHRPPRRIVFGPQSTDEMGELWLQVVPRRTNDLAQLAEARRIWGLEETAAYYQNQLRLDPNDAPAHNGLGKVLGPLGRDDEAVRHFQRAATLDPALVEPHYYLGVLFLNHRMLGQAQAAFEHTLRLDPDYGMAYTGLALLFRERGDYGQARTNLQRALRLNPRDATARNALEALPGPRR